MSTTQTPVYAAAQAGILGNAGASAASAQLNQFLGTHADDLIYPGTPILTPGTFTTEVDTVWNQQFSTVDVDQPFTMSGTSIGRVQIPLLAVGAGADLLVSLCQDSSGDPGTMICQTRIPAKWVTPLSAVAGVAGPSSQVPTVQVTGSPLAVAQFQTMGLAALAETPYPFPATTGTSAASSTATYGGYIFQIGGVNGGAALSSVFSIPFSGGVMGQAIPQPAFPTTNDGSSATCVVLDAVNGSPVVVNTGGGTSFGGSPVASVYTSNLDTSSGALSAWSSQTALPYSVQSHIMVSNDGYVYAVGGSNGSTTLNSVAYAQVQNSQITSWGTAMPLPQPTELAFVAVSNGFLFVAGGTNISLTPEFTTVWYAPINTDGSLGVWQAGPQLATAGANFNINSFGNDLGIICPGLSGVSTLTVTANGPAFQWMQQNGNLGEYPGYADQQNGTVQCVALAGAANEAAAFTANVMPYMSVPLPATGLTNGATYHILMQQQGGDLSDYLCTCVGFDSFTGNTALTSVRGAFSWSALTTNFGVSLTVFNNAAPGSVQLPLHTWEDSGARISTIVRSTTPDGRVLGLCEATRQSVQLNENAGFESGTTPWVATNCTLTQSSAQAYGGIFSALVVPNGTSSQVYISSENLPCLPGQSVAASCWAYLPLGAFSGEFGLSINWFESASAGGGYISTTSSPSITIASATWTQLINVATAPTGAYQWSLNPVENGTPTSAQVFYVDNAQAQYTFTGPQVSGVAQFHYPSAWTGGMLTGSNNPCIGTTILT